MKVIKIPLLLSDDGIAYQTVAIEITPSLQVQIIDKIAELESRNLTNIKILIGWKTMENEQSNKDESGRRMKLYEEHYQRKLLNMFGCDIYLIGSPDVGVFGIGE